VANEPEEKHLLSFADFAGEIVVCRLQFSIIHALTNSSTGEIL
jgi:hypothetical protein